MWQNSNCDKTQKLIFLQNSKTQIGTIQREYWQHSKIQNVTTEKLIFWPNSKTENVTTQQLKLWQNPKLRENSKTQIVKKHNSNCDNSKLKSWQIYFWQNFKSLLVRTTCHFDNWWDVLWSAFCNLAMFLTPVCFS